MKSRIFSAYIIFSCLVCFTTTAYAIPMGSGPKGSDSGNESSDGSGGDINENSDSAEQGFQFVSLEEPKCDKKSALYFSSCIDNTKTPGTTLGSVDTVDNAYVEAPYTETGEAPPGDEGDLDTSDSFQGGTSDGGKLTLVPGVLSGGVGDASFGSGSDNNQFGQVLASLSDALVNSFFNSTNQGGDTGPDLLGEPETMGGGGSQTGEGSDTSDSSGGVSGGSGGFGIMH
ncbi:MAG: hypothetical protein H6619_01475 [Deltaproteobacteria bacterium]|nr:hypothetical protein [Deltaproteobacteria bacterium]